MSIAVPDDADEHSAGAAPDLVGDIGGTTARFARLDEHRRPTEVRELACADHPNLPQALAAYLDQTGGAPVVRATLALAMPIEGDRLKMTNNPWDFSVEAVRRQFGMRQLTVINDVAAIAWALPYLPASALQPIGRVVDDSGRPVPPPGALVLPRRASIGVIGVGTGMGISALVPRGERDWAVIEGEGGHASFGPTDERELALLRAAWQRHPHVSAERMVSGTGMSSLHRAVCDVDGVPFQRLTPAEISARAIDGSDPACVATITAFTAMLGSIAGNLALTLGARAGICFGGGVLPRLGPAFDADLFRRRFEAKGRFAAYNARIATWMITADNPALVGAAHAPQEPPR